MRTPSICLNEALPVEIELLNLFYQKGGTQIILIDHHAEALGFEGTGVQNLISPASRGKRDQQVGLFQRQKLADGVGACTGNHNIRHGEHILQLGLQIFKLNVAGRIQKKIINLIISAQMYNLKILKQFRQSLPDGLVDAGSAKRAADHHQNRLIGGKMTQVQSGLPASLHKLLTDGRTGQNGFACGKPLHGFRKITADLFGDRNTQPVRKPRSHIGFVNDTGDF